eukprot:2064221-Rhodomonas_salina.1
MGISHQCRAVGRELQLKARAAEQEVIIGGYNGADGARSADGSSGHACCPRDPGRTQPGSIPAAVLHASRSSRLTSDASRWC